MNNCPDDKIEKLEDCNIFWGDSLDVLKLMPENSIDLVFTSPPYAGRLRNYSKEKNFNPKDLGQYEPEEYINKFIPYVKEIEKVLKYSDGGLFILNIGEKYEDGFASKYPEKLMLKICEETKFDLIDKIIWQKLDAMPNKNSRVGTLSWEYFYVFGTEPKKIKRNMDFMRTPYKADEKSISKRRDYKTLRKQTNHPMNDANCYKDIGAYPRNGICSSQSETSKEEIEYLEEHYCLFPTHSKKDNVHCAQMPIHLAEYFIGGFSNENDFILDPFGGSGTSSLAAYSLNRKFVHIDIFEENCKILEERIKKIPKKRSLYNFFGLEKKEEDKKTKQKELF